MAVPASACVFVRGWERGCDSGSLAATPVGHVLHAARMWGEDVENTEVLRCVGLEGVVCEVVNVAWAGERAMGVERAGRMVISAI